MPFIAKCCCGWKSRPWPRRNGPGKDGDNHLATMVEQADVREHDYEIVEVEDATA